MFTKKEIEEMYVGVNLDFGHRWEEDVDHHPKSLEIAEHLEALDFFYCDDSLGWNFGGDGDNGEALLYALDCYFERLDREPTLKEKVAKFASKLDRVPEAIRAMSGVPAMVTKPDTLEPRLQEIADVEGGPKESGGIFGTKPTRWWDSPTWRCEKDHVSVCLLRTEQGEVCLKCLGNVWLTFPEDKDGPLDI